MDMKENAEYIANIACRALNIPQEGIVIEQMELKIKILLQDDTLLPVIICLANSMGNTLLEAQRHYETIHPFDLERTEDSLCFVKMVENNKKCAPLSVRILLTMEAINNIFVPSFDNIIDLTNLVKTWREVLAPVNDGQTINIDTFHAELIAKNLQHLSANTPNNKLTKNK